MTLNEAVMQTEGLLFVGSSSSYVFIGTREEFDKHIDRFCEDYRTKLRSVLASNEQDFADAIKKIRFKNKEKYPLAKEMLKTVNSWELIDTEHSPLIHLLISTLDTLRTKSISIPRLKRILAEWTPWRERCVVSISKIDRGTQIIFVGEENGDYWLYEECQADMKRRKRNG